MDQVSEKNKMIEYKIKQLFKILNCYDLDGYAVPKNDEFFSEYSIPNRLMNISGFSGSAGLSVLTKRKKYLFVDGRYTTQAKIETKGYFKIFELPKTFPEDIFKKEKIKLKIGYDPSLFTSNMIKRYFGNSCNLVAVKKNLIDEITLKKNSIKNIGFYSLSSKITGENVNSKIKRLTSVLKEKKIDNLFISAPENVAWLLNIRGQDNPNSPIPNCRAVITKSKKVIIFSNQNKIKKIKNKAIYKKFTFREFNDFFSVISNLNGKSFSIDPVSCSIYYQSIISSMFKKIYFEDPCYKLKSIKNKLEINGMSKAHIEDGAALTKFLYWIKNSKIKKIDEMKVIKKLEKFRKNNKNYLYPSFDTIAGTGPNGAIIHYRVSKKTNRVIKKNDLLLCDSGGQYKFGTTDVTRTICFNKPLNKIKDIFTRVLKGHIAVVTTNLNKIKTGDKIDIRARYWLKKVNLDYSHGTGHGVGFFLNVHEGPQAISKFNNHVLKEGMILSNEPGYYLENKFGIRIENLIYVNKKNKKLYFENLTYAPIDKDLINFKLLSEKEKKYLSNYHQETYSKLSKLLNNKEANWVKSLI